MGNRQLTSAELQMMFAPLLTTVRAELMRVSSGDDDLLWALRRKLTKELSYDERGKPTQRKMLKAQKRGEQGGRCSICHDTLPQRNAVLDRIEAMKGYTVENTRLLCPTCDVKVQEANGYA